VIHCLKDEGRAKHQTKIWDQAYEKTFKAKGSRGSFDQKVKRLAGKEAKDVPMKIRLNCKRKNDEK